MQPLDLCMPPVSEDQAYAASLQLTLELVACLPKSLIVKPFGFRALLRVGAGKRCCSSCAIQPDPFQSRVSRCLSRCLAPDCVPCRNPVGVLPSRKSAYGSLLARITRWGPLFLLQTCRTSPAAGPAFRETQRYLGVGVACEILRCRAL